MTNEPLISIIITCYNQGSFLSEAIESICNQTYKNHEIIVVDDGSTDDTKAVAATYPNVVYIFQTNKGLSSARNTGILNSHGDFLVFLDADDLLYNYAIDYNLKHLIQKHHVAFVSGASQITTIDKKEIGEKKEVVVREHYLNLLKSNYIGMHGTVMYRRIIFNEFLFDPLLEACEDYDIYLKIARKYPIFHHTKKLAMYRMHNSNMSANIPKMLTTALEVLGRQKSILASEAEKKAHKEGIKGYKDFYGAGLFVQINKGTSPPSKENISILRKYNFKYYLRYKLARIIMKKATSAILKRIIPSFGFHLLYKLGIYGSYTPKIGKVKNGNFYRTSPFSKAFGYDRGGPIDRYYIENFLQDEADLIKGRVLEIGDNDYTLRFGNGKVVQSEILHIDDSNTQATIIGDLSHAPHILSNHFDCIILTQTLHLVYDFRAVIQTCYRILKPGGTLLLTVPGITPIDYGEWGKTWLWSFTGQVIEKILSEVFSKNLLKINTYGNVYIATAFLYGMGLPEIKQKMLDFHDPNIQVTITAKAIKNIQE